MPPTNPAIYYYPTSGFGAKLEIIDLGEVLSDLQMTPVRNSIDAMSYQGRFFRTNLNGRMQIRVLLERFTDRALVRKLYSLQAHLERGGLIGVTEHQHKSWAAYVLPGQGVAGATTVETGGNVFYNQSAAMEDLDEIVFQSSNPETKREWTRVSGDTINTETTLRLESALLYNYQQDPVLVRWHGFWPIMRLPANQLGRPIVTHDHRISYTLDLTLEEDVGAIAIGSGLQRGQLLQDGDNFAQYAQTIDDTMNAAPPGGSTILPPYGT